MSTTDQAMVLPVFTRDGEGVGVIYRNPQSSAEGPYSWLSVTLVSPWLKAGHEQAHGDQWDALRWVYSHAAHVAYPGCTTAAYRAQQNWIDDERAAWCDRTAYPAWQLLETREIEAVCEKCGLVDGVTLRRYLSGRDLEAHRATCPKCGTVHTAIWDDGEFTHIGDPILPGSDVPVDLSTVMR